MPSAAVNAHKRRPKYLSHLALIIICLIVGFPMIFSIVKSTQNLAQIMAYPPNFLLGNQLIENYTSALTTSSLIRLMGNTILVAIAVTIGKTLTSLLAGTAFVYFRFPLRGFLFMFVLLTLMMPTDILIVALYRMMSQLHWVNSFQALVAPFIASATGTLLFRQHFLEHSVGVGGRRADRRRGGISLPTQRADPTLVERDRRAGDDPVHQRLEFVSLAPADHQRQHAPVGAGRPERHHHQRA